MERNCIGELLKGHRISQFDDEVTHKRTCRNRALTGMIYDRVHRRIDDSPNIDTRTPCIPVILLIRVRRRLQPHLLIHVDDRHDTPGLIRGIGIGAMKGPTVMEAYFTNVKGSILIG
jgi:hypothetical protein